jgi:hypothetical protein
MRAASPTRPEMTKHGLWHDQDFSGSGGGGNGPRLKAATNTNNNTNIKDEYYSVRAKGELGKWAAMQDDLHVESKKVRKHCKLCFIIGVVIIIFGVDFSLYASYAHM